MKKLTILVGPPGSGKSTFAHQLSLKAPFPLIINQDSQGKEEHKRLFEQYIEDGLPVVVDRMNFNKEQRARYIDYAKEHGYEVEITVVHMDYNTCYARCLARENHQTIKAADDAKKALTFFFKNYERPTLEEANTLNFVYPDLLPGDVKGAVICDLDGTLCNTTHRQKWMQGEMKNWTMWNASIYKDTVNEWCKAIVNQMYNANHPVVLCSGRGEEYRDITVEWLRDNKIQYDVLLMRQAKDNRKDAIIKEIILDFEILTRFKPLVVIDDRKQVVDMWRSRGLTVLQCSEGDF